VARARLIVYLLDTNHCSRLIDRDPGVLQRLRELGDARVATCVVVRGELRFMVERSERRHENAAKVEALLEDMEVFPLDDAAADLYGQMKARLLAARGPRERRARRRVRLDALGVSDNDLWIAAIAKRHAFVVVSADDGFERMKDIVDLEVERWWFP
jgi:tRNA(fMet)-specific endonuclease VapC